MSALRVVVAIALVLVAAPAGGQTPSPAPAPAPTPALAEPAAEQELIYRGEALGILGRSLRDKTGTTIGRIADVLVNDAGQPRAAVIDVGGFMGIGIRRIAVVWRALRFQVEGGVEQIELDLSLDQIKDTPEYKRPANPADPPVSVAAPPAKP